MARAIHLGPFHGKDYRPDYELVAYRDGDPKRRIPRSRLDLRSVVSIQTTKATTDLSGTFTITLKDKRARNVLREMDVIRIRLKGHQNQQLTTVMKGVVDEVTPGGSAGTGDSDEHTTITGRCPGKYLQINSLFLPVWDATGALPTALTFGLGDVTRKASPTYKAGGTTPYDIFRYLALNYVFGGNGVVGTAGTPNAKHWLDYHSRFARDLGFNIPFLQFNEDAVSTALQSMAVLGFTEAWIDELGRVVYRRPQWDQPVRYIVHTDALIDWSFPRSDVNTATYVEVIPSGDPGVGSATAQALRAGRAPVPSSYVRAGNGKGTQLGKNVSPEYVIDSDRSGKPTSQGRANPWYIRQRRLGLRPQQINSPLIVDQAQAQAQAEGLLRFASRMDKGLQFTIPGCPELRLGFTARVHGELEGLPFDRAGYTEQIVHNYTEGPQGGEYTTSVLATHGRDARDPFTGRPDPKWGAITLPSFDPTDVVHRPGGGVVAPQQPANRGEYRNPIGAGLSLGRTDQGVDFSGSGPLYTIGRCKITRVSPIGSTTGWPGPNGSSGSMIVYKLLEGYRQGDHVYLAENVDPATGLKVGDVLDAGTRYAHARGAYPFLEIGWAADGSGTTLAAANGTRDLHPNHSDTPEGQNFLAMLKNLGVRV